MTLDLFPPIGTATLYIGDVFDWLATLEDGSVDLILTSPPFLALRSYLPADHPDKGKEIGSEPAPAAFLDTLLALTAEWRRVLAPHGSLCVELGDTYAGDDRRNTETPDARVAHRANGRAGSSRANVGPGWPLAKSLCGIPHLYHLSLAYGRNLLTGAESPAGQWRVRNVVAWCRPNPPVGALGDKFRPATSYMTVACVGPKRWFDLDAVRGEPSPNTHARTAKGVEARESTGKSADDERRGGNFSTLATLHSTAGAPPLDWWAIPTQPYITPSGTLIVPAAGTFHQVRVPVGAGADGIRRTTSPSCPVHGSLDHPGSSAPDDGRGGSESSRTGRTDVRPVPAPAPGSPPTSSSSGQMALGEDPADPAATPRSTGARRTDPAPATSPPGTPCARNSARTDGTQDEPASSAPHPGTPSSSSAEACPPAAEPGTEPRTAHTSDPSSACTCSHYVEVSIASESTWDYATWPDDWWNIPTQGFKGAHYATWPEALCARPIEAMCPRRVCRTCGEPSERVVDSQRCLDGEPVENPPAMGDDKARRVQAGEPANWRWSTERTTLGWTDCGHDDWRNGLVLDPFAGSGTTLAVAVGRGRDAIGIDLDARNAELALARCDIGGTGAPNPLTIK